MWYHLHVAGHWVQHSWVVTCYGLHVAGHWVQQLSGDVVRPTCGWTLGTTAEWWCGTTYMWLDTGYNSWVVTWYHLHVAGHWVQQLSSDVVPPTCGWTLGTTAEWWCTTYMWLDTGYDSWVVTWYSLHVAGHWVQHSRKVTWYGLHVAGHWVQQLSGDVVRPTCGWTLGTTAEGWRGTAYMWLDTGYNSWVVTWYGLHASVISGAKQQTSSLIFNLLTL